MIRTFCLRAAIALAAATLLLGAAAPASAVVPPTATATTAADAAAWSVIPADNDNGTGRGNYGYEVDPGATISDALVVNNTGSEPLELTLYAADAFTTSEGILDLQLADAPKVDSGAWIALSTGTLTLQPGESREVPFTITVPADARPGDHPGGIITSLTSAETGSTLAVDRRLGIRVHLRVSGELSPQAEVTDASASFAASGNPFAGGVVTVSYTLTNTGDTRITASDAIAAAGPLGVGAVAASPQSTAEILPGSSIIVERTLSDIAPLGWFGGTLTVAPEAVGAGAGVLEPISIELSTAAVSWALIAVVAGVIIVAGVVVVLVLRRRGRAVPVQ